MWHSKELICHERFRFARNQTSKINKKWKPIWRHVYVLHSHMQAIIKNHNDYIKKTSDSVLREIYLSLYLKGLCVRGSWRPNRTVTYWPSLIWPSAFLYRSPGFLNRRPSSLLGAGFLYRILSPTGLVSKTVWISCALSYIIVQRPLNLPLQLAIGICTSAVFRIACLIVIERK